MRLPRGSSFDADLALEWVEEGPTREIFLPRLAELARADGGRAPRQLRQRATELCRRIQRELTEPP